MLTAHIWNKFGLYCRQVTLTVLFVLIGVLAAQGQDRSKLNLPFFDSQKWHYGFLLGIHESRFDLRYSDNYVSTELDTLHSIVAEGRTGFRLGFVIDYHIHDVFDIRLNPTVTFNQLNLDYRYTDGQVINSLTDPTFTELPILMKYKSARQGNRRMYALAGVSPSFRVSGNKEKEDKTERLLLKNFNLNIEVGAGFDLYQSMFKFSPEIRYSYGLFNLIDKSKPSFYSDPIESLAVHSISFYATFEGGPSELKMGGKKKKRKRGR